MPTTTDQDRDLFERICKSLRELRWDAEQDEEHESATEMTTLLTRIIEATEDGRQPIPTGLLIEAWDICAI